MSDKPCERNSTWHNQKLSEFDANRLMAKPETPPNYMPKVDAPPLGYSHDFIAVVAVLVIGVILGAVGLLYFLTWW